MVTWVEVTLVKYLHAKCLDLLVVSVCVCECTCVYLCVHMFT